MPDSGEKPSVEEDGFVKPDTNIVDIFQLVNNSGRTPIPVIGDEKYLHGLVTKASLLTVPSQQYITEEEAIDGSV